MPNPIAANRTPDAPTESGVTTAVAILAIVLLPFWYSRFTWSPPVAEIAWDQVISIRLSYLPVAVLVAVLGLQALRGRPSPAGPVRFAWMCLWALLGWGLVSTAANPSWFALNRYFCVAGAIALGLSVARSRGNAKIALLAAITGLAASQAVLGLAQTVLRGTVGLSMAEGSPDRVVDGHFTAVGSYFHSYRLATLLLAGVGAALVLWFNARGRLRVFAGASLMCIGLALPFTFSRASLLGLVPLVVIGVSGVRALRRPTLLLALALVIGGALTASGWVTKADKGGGLDGISSGRVTLAQQALDTTLDNPIFGVGTGRYVVDVAEDSGEVRMPPHNVVLHIAAETGIPGLIFISLLVAAVSLWVVTGGRLTIMVAIAVAPLFFLDWFPYAHDRGIFISGLWWGCVALARRTDAEPRTVRALKKIPDQRTSTVVGAIA